MFLTDDPHCPRCGSAKLREPREDDPAFLISKEALWAGGIEETLKQNGIPCLNKGLLGAGFTARIGYTAEVYEFFVPYAAYDKAKELLAEMYDTEDE